MEGIIKDISIFEHFQLHLHAARSSALAGRAREKALARSLNELRITQQALRRISDNLPDLVWAKDLENRYTFANRAMCERLLFAVDPEEPIGKTDLFFAERERASHPDRPDWYTFGEVCRDSDAEIFRTGGSARFIESGNVRGRRLCLDVHTAPVFDEEGNPVGTVGIARDVTGEMEMRGTFGENERLHRNMADMNLAGLYVSTFDGRIEDCNQAFIDILGYATFDEMRALFAGALYPSSEQRDTLLELLRTNGVVRNLEFRLRKKDGSTCWTLLNARRDGDRILGSVVDITQLRTTTDALRRSEENFRLIAENISDVLWIIDINLCLRYVSPSVTSFLGYDVEELLDSTLTDYLSPGSVEAITTLQRELHHDGGGAAEHVIRPESDTLQLQHIHKDGSTRWGEIRLSVVRDGSGIVTGFQGVTRDITERKAVEQQLRNYSTELKDLNAAKDRFFSIMAHDLKSPFSAIMGFSELLCNEYDQYNDAEKQVFIRNIHHASENTFKLVENLLEWSRTQTHSVDFHPALCDLSLLANESIHQIKSQADAKSIHIHSSIMYGTQVFADANMINTVFRNLLSNAVKFTAIGGAVRIRAVEVLETLVRDMHRSTPDQPAVTKQAMIRVSVSDTGVGIKEENIDKLFRIDQKILTKGTMNEKGTGLGLLLCKELIERQGGVLSVESTVGKGSTFHFTLPGNE